LPSPFPILVYMERPNNRFIYVLYGPTGVGKTDCADLIGSSIPIEIINMDVGQLYEPFTIGTAKPDWRSSTIEHHMFDVMVEPKDFSCVAYRSHIEKLVLDIWNRGAVPLFVGGSGFYLRSLFFASDDNELLPQDALPYPPGTNLWDTLYAIDPIRALKIPYNDIYRLTRALTLWHTTGIKPSAQSPTFKPIAPAALFFLTRERSELYDRINNRVDHMLHAGWLNEILPLIETAWHPFIMRKKLIGYNDLISYALSDQTITGWHDTIALIKKRTRNYAKRQETYGRMLERELLDSAARYPDMIDICKLNLTSLDLDQYIKRLFIHRQLVTGKAYTVNG
jgi:tRNA dimethylallyltransferase